MAGPLLEPPRPPHPPVLGSSSDTNSLGLLGILASIPAVHAFVGYWHLADSPDTPTFARFWTKVDKGGLWPAMICPLVTQADFQDCRSIVAFEERANLQFAD